MKKVLYTATVDSHIKHFHLPYLQWFKEQGYEVHVATNGKEEIPYCDKKHIVSFERNPIKINNLKAIKQLKEIINKEKFDVIHCHTPMGGVITRIAARKARKDFKTRVIYTAHGFHFYKGAPFLNWFIYYPVEKMLSNITDCLITINQEDYDLAKKKFKAKQIEFVNGVGVNFQNFNFEVSEKQKEVLKEKININNRDFVIIYPAELTKRKNQGMLLKAVALLKKEGYKKIKVLLPGLDSMNGEYQKLAKELEIEDMIRFLGYRTDIPQLMKISNLSISTSRQEGLPFNLIEAMIVGLPIIATDCRGNRDLVEHCVEIGDVVELKNRIIEIMNAKIETQKYDIEKYKIENILLDMQKILLK